MTLCTVLIVTLLAGINAGGEILFSEETLTLPTYETMPPDKLPLFFRSEDVQLAERHIYPYPFYDVQSGDKKDIQYKALILENEYLRLCVLPELGGRFYSMLDKTTGYEAVYKNRVVKPALIGTLGAWISGGVEWNTPHHHRATSMIPVDYAVSKNEADGSVTVWVGEYEKRCRTRWMTGLTLSPGKAYVKATFKSMNVTPLQYPALYFANAAVPVNDDYQFIFPPDVELMTFHYVTEFCRWPVLNQVFQSYDYTHGENLSWWNAAKQPVSFFVMETRRDFMGGIDHGRGTGIVLVGDHRIFKGKKLWNWGKNEVQEVWDEKLTDEDGPYAELMMGFYSDNQPDYNFVAPFETKYGDMYFYGIKGLRDIKEANRDLAVNLEIKGRKALIQINANLALQDVKLALLGSGKVLLEKTIQLDPSALYETFATLSRKTKMEDLQITLTGADGAELLAWEQPVKKNEPFPEVYHDPLPPDEYTTSQDAYFAGLKLEQFGNTNFDYMKYYERAIALNPADVATNTRLGLIYLKRGEFDRAEGFLREAVRVVTDNHKKARDAESLYYLGLCLMYQNKVDEALDLLYRSTWDYTWTSAGYTLATQLESRQGRFEKGLEAADRAWRANQDNVEACQCMALLYRRLKECSAAQNMQQRWLELDPMNILARNERILLSGGYSECDPALVTDLLALMRDEPYNFIESAIRYASFGFYQDAAAILRLAADSDLPALNAYPMIYYHLALYQDRAGCPEAAAGSLAKAAGLSTAHCFPYGLESIEVLRYALSKNPENVSALYLLGNALADYQHDAAVACWAKAAELNSSDPVLFRNMAYIQAHHFRDMPKALDNIMRALSLDPSEPRYFSEAHLYMSYASLSPEELEQFLEEYAGTSGHMTDIQLMQVKLNIFRGNCAEAIALLERMEYHIKEGADFNPHVYWFDAHLYAGIEAMEQGNYEEAKARFLRAMEFPKNLEAERNGKIGIALYYLGLNSLASGNAAEAREYFNQMSGYTYTQGWGAGDFPEIAYYQALARSQLGEKEEVVQEIFRKLIADGESRLAVRTDSRHITVSVDESHSGRIFLLEKEIARKNLRVSSYYMQGLGYLGLGDREKAKSFFNQALQVDPLHVDAQRMLQSL